MDRFIFSEELEKFLIKKFIKNYRLSAAEFDDHFERWVDEIPQGKWNSYIKQFNK